MAMGSAAGARGAGHAGRWPDLIARLLDAGAGSGPDVVRVPRVARRLGRLRRQQPRGPALARNPGGNGHGARPRPSRRRRPPRPPAPPVTVSPDVPVATLRPARAPRRPRQRQPLRRTHRPPPPCPRPMLTPERRDVDGSTHRPDRPHHRAATHAATERGDGAVRRRRVPTRWPPSRPRSSCSPPSMCRGTSCPSPAARRIVRSSARSSTRRPVRSAGVWSSWPGSSSPWRSDPRGHPRRADAVVPRIQERRHVDEH